MLCRSVSGHGGVPPCPGSTRLSLGVRGSCGACPLRPPLRALRVYIRPHFVKCAPVAALKLRLVSPTASRPRGFTKQALCKVACAGGGHTAVGASRSLARPTRRRLALCGLSWHLGIGQALRAMCLASGLRPVIWCVPRPPCGLAAARHWPALVCPSAPKGLPQPSGKTNIPMQLGVLRTPNTCPEFVNSSYIRPYIERPRKKPAIYSIAGFPLFIWGG